MASPHVIDIDALAAPIPGEKATGVNLREDAGLSVYYYQVKDARTAARSAERNAVIDDGAGEPPNWRPVLDVGKSILRERSKNLEIVAWMIEALARVHGFAGIRDGFALARRLVESYWDELYPEPDEDGIVTKVAPLTGLNGEGGEGTLIVPIACVPLTEGSTCGPFASFQYDQAREVARIQDEDKKQAKIASGYVSMEAFETAVRETAPDWFQNTADDIAGALEEYDALIAALDERCGADSPPSSNIRGAIETVQQTFKFITRDILAGPATEEGAPSEESEEGAVENPTPAPAAQAAPGEIRNREDAFRAIKKVADYFREAEPHSPLPYVLEQAIRWGRLPLPELLKEVIPDDSARTNYFRLTGIPQND